MEKDKLYFISDLLVRFIIDFNLPVARGTNRHSFFREGRKIIYTQSLLP